jgi:dihydropteroate synthase type 2
VIQKSDIGNQKSEVSGGFRFSGSDSRIRILGIVNITEDSFSDGGRYLSAEAAITHARRLAADGAAVIDLGGAASNPDAKPVAPEVEIARLAPVVAALKRDGIAVSVDSFSPQVQRWALDENVDYLNDIRGFPEPALYPALAASPAKLIVMHAVDGAATRAEVASGDIMAHLLTFFERRIAALAAAGIARERLILDPGMGFFLGALPETSFAVLRGLSELKRAFALPVLVSVSRKSFLRRLIGRNAAQSGPASLAAELFAAEQGADYIRTHEPGALRDALLVLGAATSCNAT